MQNVNIFKVNESVTEDMTPQHQLTRLTGEQAEVMIEELVKPIKFRCANSQQHTLFTH